MLKDSQAENWRTAEDRSTNDDTERAECNSSDDRAIHNVEGDVADAELTLMIRTPEEGEAQAFGIKLGIVYRQLVDHFRSQYQLDTAQAVVEVQQWLLAQVQAIGLEGEGLGLNVPPSEVTWAQLNALAEHDPSAIPKVWRAINQAAVDEFQCGYRAAAVVATAKESPWDRAQFLALRTSMMHEWEPRGAVEMSLIDIMAQAQILQERWIKRLTEATETQAEYTSSIYSSRAVREAPRLSDGQAIEQASLMADRFNRLYLRTLRQLRDLRRYSPTVSIRNAGQVSIGGQQLNVAQGDQSVPE